MLKFFRRIRHKLLDEGNLNRYMLYAIGEILLVVVGILIALQLNNWNEERNAKNFEKKLLTEIHYTLTNDLGQWNRGIQKTERIIESLNILSNHMENDLMYHDSLDIHFGNAKDWFIQLINESAYQTAKTYGLHFMENDTTRLLLSRFYEEDLKWIRTMESRQHDYHFMTVVPMLTENFNSILGWKSDHSSYSITPRNYEELKENIEFKSMVNTNLENRKRDIYFFKLFREFLIDIKNRLETEIRNMNKN